MANPPLTETLVYSTLKHIFTGDPIPPSTLKTIRKRIEKFRDAKIGALIEKHGVESIAKVAKVLVDDQIFQSTAKAKLRFPDIVHVLPPSQDNKSIPTAPKAMVSSAGAVQHVGKYSPEKLLDIRDGINVSERKERIETSTLVRQTFQFDHISK
jgi:hypothetical protein